MTVPLAQMFGCPSCRALPRSAADLPYQLVQEIFDSSHLAYSLLKCTHCGWYFLSKFLEMVDWDGGNDLMWNSWTPISEEEARKILAMFPTDIKGSVNFEILEELEEKHPRLVQNPKGNYNWIDAGGHVMDIVHPG